MDKIHPASSGVKYISSFFPFNVDLPLWSAYISDAKGELRMSPEKKRPRGRPKKPGRRCIATLYLTEDERQVIEKAASDSALTVTAYIRSAALLAARSTVA